MNSKKEELRGEKNSEKISEFRMGIGPMALQTLIRCSNYWATENSGDEQVIWGPT